jgi:ubiquinone/menaquinone biosynthesis C-methylase UbiE
LDESYLTNVRQQYEHFPYPPRDPAEERRRLLEVEIDRLATINFYCFNGAMDFEGARVLVAGGGTGDSTIYLAEQLLKRNAEVVYLDISEAAMEIAKQRAAIRKLGNISWLHASIMSLSTETAGLFDYISCTGVLHHLDDPAVALKRLRSVLRPRGGMGLMLYGKYGRTGVYQMQRLMRIINTHEHDFSGKIANTRRVLQELPPTNWFRHNESFLIDHKDLGDSGLVDLLLHEQDVAYSIDEVHALLAVADLHFVEFADVRMRMSYRPEQYIRDPMLLEKIAKLDRVRQQSIAELLVGLFKQHVFYASARTDSQARLGKLTDAPFFLPARSYLNCGPQIAEAMAKNPHRLIPLRHATGFEFDVVSNPILAAIFKHIDGVRNWCQIFALAQAEVSGLERSNEELLDYFRPIFEQFRQLDWMLLRNAAISDFPDTVELQAESERRR